MGEVWIAAVGVAASIGFASYQVATAPGMPGTPNLAGASRAGTEAEAETLADRRRLEAAAQQGISAPYTVAAHTEKQQVGYVSVPLAGGRRDRRGQPITQSVRYVASEWQPGGKYYVAGQAAPQITYRTENVRVPAGQATADFTGFGEADVQGKVARENAQNILDLEKKYGADFIQEALKEQQLADPQGSAARARMYDLIKEQEDAHPDRPVAALLQSQVSDQLAAGKGLEKISSQVLNEAVGKAQAARGEVPSSSPDYAEPLTTGFEGEQRLSAAEQKALGWLTSGATPEDVEYRRRQQTLADLSSFVNNRTPESQFAALSGAQQGPAPYNPGTQLARQNPNAGPAAQSAALQGWNTQLTAAQNTANPWMAGLSALLRGANAAGNAGWQPFAANPGH